MTSFLVSNKILFYRIYIYCIILVFLQSFVFRNLWNRASHHFKKYFFRQWLNSHASCAVAYFNITLNKRQLSWAEEWVNFFSAHWFWFAFSSIHRFLYTWTNDVVSRGIRYCILIIQIFFGQKVIQISKHVHFRHRLSVFNTLIICMWRDLAPWP